MEQSVQSSSQSPWMAHWRTRRSCGEGEHNFNQPFDILRKKENGGKTDITMTNLSKGIKIIEKGICKSGNNVDCQSFHNDGNGKIAGTSKALKGKQAAFNVDLLQPRNNHDSFNTSLRGMCSDFEVPLQITDDPTKTPTLFGFGDSCYSTPRPSVEEEPHNLQSGVDNSYRRVTFFPSVRDKLALASKEHLRDSECDDFNRNRRSSFLACEKKSEVLSISERSMAACLQDVIASPLQAAPSTSKNPSPAFQKIWNFSGTKHVPSSAAKLSEKNSLKMSDHGFNTNAKFQSSFNEVETTRICTTVDSVVGLSGRHSRFQTTHSFLITKKTDFNLFKSDQTHTNSRRRTDVHSFSKVARVPSPFRHVQHGVKLQSLHGFTDFGVKEKSKDVNGLSKFASGRKEKNAEDAGDFEDPMHRKGKRAAHDKGLCFDLNSESSAGTDIMDLYDFNAAGVNASPPVKVIKLGSTTRRPVLSSGGEEDGPRRHKTKLPDMNLEAPTSPVEEQMLDYEEPSTSRTQSLDKETVLAHAEQDNPLESANDLGGSLKPEPGGRWLKRLKLSSSALYSIGTKSSDLTEKSHHKRENLSVERFLKGGMASLKATASRNHAKEVMVLDETTTLKPHGESSYTDSGKKDRDLLLSKSWIRRWCHHEEATPKKNPNAEMAGEPRSSNILLKDIEKKQFPSIAAMALMAKAMKCSERYDIHNRGAFVVWSTKGF